MAECSDCGAPLIWARHLETGSRMPLNAAPVPDPSAPGTFLLITDAARPGSVRCAPLPLAATAYVRTHPEVALAEATAVLTEVGLAYTSHFADCPGAERFRRRRLGRTAGGAG
jgi:hypothetical protein